jgi:hypothetical protein
MQANPALNPDSVRGAYVVTCATPGRLGLCVPVLFDGRIWGCDGHSLLSLPTSAKGRGFILPVGTKWSEIPNDEKLVKFLNDRFHQPKSYETEKGFYVVKEGEDGAPEQVPPFWGLIKTQVRQEGDLIGQDPVRPAVQFSVLPDQLDAMRQGCGLHFYGDGGREMGFAFVPHAAGPLATLHAYARVVDESGKKFRLEWVGAVTPANMKQCELTAEQLTAMIPRPPQAKKKPEPAPIESVPAVESPKQEALAL